MLLASIQEALVETQLRRVARYAHSLRGKQLLLVLRLPLLIPELAQQLVTLESGGALELLPGDEPAEDLTRHLPVACPESVGAGEVHPVALKLFSQVDSFVSKPGDDVRQERLPLCLIPGGSMARRTHSPAQTAHKNEHHSPQCHTHTHSFTRPRTN